VFKNVAKNVQHKNVLIDTPDRHISHIKLCTKFINISLEKNMWKNIDQHVKQVAK